MLFSSASVSVPPLSILFLLIFPFLLLQVQATVPPSKTFKYVNQGEFGEYVVEYDASYRVLDVFTFPFQLCFYNTTPDAFTLALRMGTRRSESIMRWVWEANLGNPVRENATLTFGRDGNLVLADADGRVAWQTATANKGIVGFKLLPSGNIVLHDKQGRFVWQSFDHPTDTLLVGQELRLGGPTKVVSRVSSVDGSQGPYSFVLEQNRVALYLKSNNSPKPLLYYYSELGSGQPGQEPLAYVKFNSEPETEEAYAFDLEFDYAMINSSSVSRRIWARPKYNATYSMLRVESDGNLKIYTYSDKVDWGAWEVTFTLFDRDGSMSECKLPTRCGSLGVCEDDQCVACPTPLGLTWWSKNCAPPALPPCKSRANVTNYYKIVGVEHFLNEYTEGDGPMKLAECRDKCNKDCGCLGFFYREESSKCLMAPELGTLTKVSNTSHIAFIKLSK